VTRLTDDGALVRTRVVIVAVADQVDAAGEFAHLSVAGVPVARRGGARQRPGGAGRRRRSPAALVEQTAEFALERVRHVRLDVDAESADAVDRLLQLVGLRSLVGRRLRQTLGAERAQQQRQEQVQHLHIEPVSK